MTAGATAAYRHVFVKLSSRKGSIIIAVTSRTIQCRWKMEFVLANTNVSIMTQGAILGIDTGMRKNGTGKARGGMTG